MASFFWWGRGAGCCFAPGDDPLEFLQQKRREAARLKSFEEFLWHGLGFPPISMGFGFRASRFFCGFPPP